MKYLSTILFLAAMYWSWGLASREQAVPQQVHVSIQDDLKNLIVNYIRENLPNAKNLRFERFWTEALNDNKVKATFAYSFEDASEDVGAARVMIEGFAVLNRAKETPDNIEWTFDELQILNSQVDYQDPIKVSPHGAEAKPANGETPSTEPAPNAVPQEAKGG